MFESFNKQLTDILWANGVFFSLPPKSLFPKLKIICAFFLKVTDFKFEMYIVTYM